MKETYKKRDNDTPKKNIKLWVYKNPNLFFRHQEKCDGRRELINIHFKCSILLIRHMMLKYGHESGVVIDTTFGMNENKMYTYTIVLVFN
jgi:hypothetical protein